MKFMNGDETILLIERTTGSHAGFADSLRKKAYSLSVVATGREAFEYLEDNECVLVILNAASLGTSGERICQRLVDVLEDTPLIHIMPETVSQKKVDASLADITLVMPFTARKLVNRIKRLTHNGEDSGIKVGKSLYIQEIRLVQGYGREKRLTPKTAALLELFISHPEKTLERGFLMEQVWDTDYIGDTRTLDVHIRWVREAIEKNPAKPKYLKTVRGKGYRYQPRKKKKKKKNSSKSVDAKPGSSKTKPASNLNGAAPNGTKTHPNGVGDTSKKAKPSVDQEKAPSGKAETNVSSTSPS